MHSLAAIYKQDRHFMRKKLFILDLNLFKYKKTHFFKKVCNKNSIKCVIIIVII
jgi:hypothetical protein